MLPLECQVCDNFDVSRTTCCGSFVPSTHFSSEITDFVRRRYAGQVISAAVDNELFRLLNEDVRYELVSLYEDTTTWSAAYSFQAAAQERRLPAGLTRVAQTSAFVHIRVLSSFLVGHVDRSNESHPKDFNAKIGASAYLDHWRPSINSNVLHLNKLRPSPTVQKKTGKVVYPPNGVQHEVEHLTNEVTRLWRDFVADSNMSPYGALSEHIDDEARHHAERVRGRLAKILGVSEAQIPWRPPLK